MTLRVAHVLNSPGRGGVPRVVHALVRHTDRAHVTPHLFYLKGGDGPDLFDDIDIPKRSAASSSKAAAMTELVAWLEAHRIDILHTHSFRPNLYARMAGAVLKPSGLRIVAHYHNDYSDKWHGDVLALERRLADITDAAIAVSGAVADHVSRAVGIEAEVIGNGIDLSRVTDGSRAAGRSILGLDAEALAIGLVGRVCHQKGVDTFVEAAMRIAPQHPTACFLIIGDPEDSGLVETLTERIAAAGLDTSIRFMGHTEAMADVLAALDLLAAPSRWEGFGLSVAEAMAAGVPVVASDVGGLPHVTGGAACLVCPDNPQTLAVAIEALLSDKTSRQALSRAGRAEAPRFDWARSAEAVHALYLRTGSER